MSKLSETRRRINAMGMAEAQEELKTLRRKLFELRLQLARGEVKNNRQFPQVRTDIARLMHRMGELNRMGPEEREEEAVEKAIASPATSGAIDAPAARPVRATRTPRARKATTPDEAAESVEPVEAEEPAETQATAESPSE